MNRSIFSLTLVFGLNLVATDPAAAFSEDICYAYQKDTIGLDTDAVIPRPFNCTDLNCSDGTDGDNQGASCAVSGFGTLVAADMLYKLHGRNSVHFDVVWLLGRVMGLSKQDSNDLAAFNQATDLGHYRNFDYTGTQVLFESENIEGVQRTNKDTDGFWFHFVPWYRQPSDTEDQHSLTYDSSHSKGESPFPEWEVPLNHVRAWAFGQRKTLCSFGITQTDALGYPPLDGSCYPENQPARLDFYLTMFGPVAVDETTEIFGQKIQPCDNENDRSGEQDTCYKTDYDQQISGDIKALGIYLHMLGDRLSHFLCSDYSAIEAEAQDGKTTVDQFKLRYALSCGTGTHLAMHVRETGHTPVPERTRDTVQYTLNEIDDWIQTTGYVRQPTYVADSKERDRIVERILEEAIPQTCAAHRLEALCKIAHDYGLGWHDENPSCSYQALNCDQP